LRRQPFFGNMISPLPPSPKIRPSTSLLLVAELQIGNCHATLNCIHHGLMIASLQFWSIIAPQCKKRHVREPTMPKKLCSLALPALHTTAMALQRGQHNCQ
jgi:hypothetical protein